MRAVEAVRTRFWSTPPRPPCAVPIPTRPWAVAPPGGGLALPGMGGGATDESGCRFCGVVALHPTSRGAQGFTDAVCGGHIEEV